MKQFLLRTFAMVCIVFGIASCSDDNEPKKLTLAQDQPTSVTADADETAGTIDFNASGAWSAWTSTQSRAPEKIEWLSLNNTNGSAGDNTITYSLEPNNTGSTRTAYIIIVCEDEQLAVKITQTDAEDSEENLPNANGRVFITCERYNVHDGEGYYLDGTYTYEIIYSPQGPTQFVSKWRDDMVSAPGEEEHDSYCLNEEKTEFMRLGDEIKATMRTDITYYPSGRTEVEDKSEHYATLENGYAVEGWYRWDEDRTRTDWKASYDANGYLKQTQNNDATSNWDTFNFTWKDNCITKIDWTSGKNIIINYNDNSLINLHSQFDINWALFNDLEIYDFAAGDVTRIWACCGLMGKPSKLLITEITENDGYNTRSYRMDYKSNTTGGTQVRVTEFVDGIQQSYTDWDIEYDNIK